MRTALVAWAADMRYLVPTLAAVSLGLSHRVAAQKQTEGYAAVATGSDHP